MSVGGLVGGALGALTGLLGGREKKQAVPAPQAPQVAGESEEALRRKRVARSSVLSKNEEDNVDSTRKKLLGA